MRVKAERVVRWTAFVRSMIAILAVLVTSLAIAQERPMITGVAFVRVTTADSKSSQNFYGTTLGFSGATHPNGVRRYSVNSLQWFEVQEQAVAPTAGRLAAIGFSTRDVVALERYLQSKGLTIEVQLHDAMFGVRDPEGNLIYFVQEHPMPNILPSPRQLSRRMTHAGFIVRDRAKEDMFYHDLLGFHQYWAGGMKSGGDPDWVNMQVPDGSDCIEYMLHQAPSPGVKQLGIMNHFAFGVTKISSAVSQLKKNGCAPGAVCEDAHMGREGKMGLNLYDPDGTRVELMEFVPSGTNYGDPFTGKHPQEKEDR